MYLDMPDFLLAASVVQALMVSLFLLFPSNIRHTSNQLLAVVLISMAAGYSEIFLYGVGVTVRHPNFAYIGTLISMLQPPAIYLYTRSLIFRSFRIELRHAAHLLPFLAATTIFAVGYYLQPIDSKRQTLLQQDLPGMPASLWLALAIHGIFLIYLFSAIRLLRHFSEDVKKISSDIESRKMSWLTLLLSGYAMVWIVSLAYCLSFYVFKLSAGVRYISMFGGISAFLFIGTMLIYALKQSAILSGLTKEETELLEPVRAQDDSALPTVEQKQVVEQFMESHRPYLNANLSLSQLAKLIGMPPRELSTVINQGFGKNFFDFIGGYRIRQARLLLESGAKDKTILDIMYESGFNSKSVFNTAFKQETGMTPSQYRKESLGGRPPS